MGALIIFGSGFIIAAENPQTQNTIQQRIETRVQSRILFVDEDGDGICDFARDHDNDGIPNCQDPDWTRPQDGTGYKNRKGNNFSSNQFGNRNGYHGGNSWNNQSFRQNQASFGSGVCDGTGPKSRGARRGRG